MRNNRIVALTLAALIAIPLYAQTAGELLQKGIYSQETAGDLDGAISVYRQIVNSASSPRDIAAQAQYRLAQSLLQKGDLANGAQEFSNLAKNYADYGKLVSNLATQARGLSRPSEYDADRAAQQRVVAEQARAAQADETQRIALAAARAGVTVSAEQQKSVASLLAEAEARLQGLRAAQQTLSNEQKLATGGSPAGEAIRVEGSGGRAAGDYQADLERLTLRNAMDLASADRIKTVEAQLDALKAQQQATEAERAAGTGRGPAVDQSAKMAALLAEVQALMAGRISAGAGGRGLGTNPPGSRPFDPSKRVTVTGATVVKVQWTNPMATVYVDTKEGSGKRYIFVLTAPNMLIRRYGMTRTSLRVGDQVTMTGILATGGQAMPDGTIAASASTITRPDGSVVFDRVNPCVWVAPATPVDHPVACPTGGPAQ